MKKLLFALFIVILLVGCSTTEEKEYTKPTADVDGPEVSETDLPAEQIPKKTVSEVSGEPLTSDIKEMLAKADKVESLDYSYSEFVKGEAGYYAHVSLMDNKMKQVIELGSGTFAAGTHYDTVYLDLAKKTAVGYCEDEGTCNNRDDEISVNFGDFVITSPYDMIDEIQYGYIRGTAMFDKREVSIIEYEKAGNTARVWVWEYRGLPLKYEEYDDDVLVKEITFKGLAVNTVDDEDLVHQILEEKNK